ncbi:zinc finger protein 436 [Cyclopterus lumpus]|uniref:zinc finger protein 436 n=1 Tax=Cyclopterus lumpus TaxID=8103 RepID=UPI001486D051|nr:zinc finger protein 436 [Cyclopterus lumpus]XP_034410736.1 zinc finger protein 436 [Cyclopterus lumpus]
MENSGFQSQLLSVMEVLAKAAVAEIHRTVDDSCAVLRLEVSQSRRDIDLLRRKCEGMEAELRRTRRRARRKGFYPPAAERFSPLVKVVLNRGSRSSGWDAEAQSQPQQVADVEPADEAEHILIKEEFADEEKLISGAEQPPCFASQADGFAERYLSAESAADPGGPVSPPDGYAAFPGRRNEAPVFLVKREDDEEPDENAAPELFAMEDGDRPPWSSDPCGDAVDPSFPCAEHQFEPIPFGFPSQSGSHLEDGGPRMHSAGKSHSASAAAARAKRRARALGCKRSQPDDGHGALSQINAVDGGPIPQPSLQLQYRDPNEENPAASSFCGHNRGGGGGFGLARRMRTPWRSGVGEKRFNCTFCDKGFVRFSQLKEHLRSHTGEKPFSCLQCGRSFTKQCNLIRHAVVHSGEKPYECSLCGKCFTQRSSLKSHQKTAH